MLRAMGIFQRLLGREPVPSAAQLQAAGARVIDVRTSREFAGGHVAGARNLDVNQTNFAASVKRLDARQQYVVYCQSGGRSRHAVGLLRSAGLNAIDGGSLADMTANGWQLGR